MKLSGRNAGPHEVADTPLRDWVKWDSGQSVQTSLQAASAAELCFTEDERLLAAELTAERGRPGKSSSSFLSFRVFEFQSSECTNSEISSSCGRFFRLIGQVCEPDVHGRVRPRCGPAAWLLAWLSRRAAAGRAQLLAKKGASGRMQRPLELVPIP